MKIRNKLIIGFSAIILFSGVMGFTAVDGILRTSRLTNELFEYPLMASNFARGAQTAFVRMRVAGDNEPVAADQEQVLREDLAIVTERLRDPAGAGLIAHIEHDLKRLADLRAKKARLIETGGRLGETLLRQHVASAEIDANLEALVELAVVEGAVWVAAVEEQAENAGEDLDREQLLGGLLEVFKNNAQDKYGEYIPTNARYRVTSNRS